MMTIRKAESIGFCTGVRHAIDTVTEAATEHGSLETLGALVHNKQVIQRLANLNIGIVGSISDIKGKTVVISAHGVGPGVRKELDKKGISVIDTTCAYVKRAQKAARRLLEDGFFTVIYGDNNHPEVKGILGWADGNGMATLEAADLKRLPEVPKRIGILSQTTQIPTDFIRFLKEVIDIAFVKDAEIRLIDTICHETRRRQADTLRLANESDLMIVIGGRNSANTRRLYELCASKADTQWVETAEEIEPKWLNNKHTIGITAGTSTDDETINEVTNRLKGLK